MCLDFHVRAREDIDLKTIPNLFISNDVILIRNFFCLVFMVLTQKNKSQNQYT